MCSCTLCLADKFPTSNVPHHHHCKGILDLSGPLCIYSRTLESSGLFPDSSMYFLLALDPSDTLRPSSTYTYIHLHLPSCIISCPQIDRDHLPLMDTMQPAGCSYQKQHSHSIMYLVPLAEGYSSARYSLVPGTPLAIIHADIQPCLVK